MINKVLLFTLLFLLGVFISSYNLISLSVVLFFFLISLSFYILYVFKKDTLFIIIFIVFFAFSFGLLRAHIYTQTHVPLIDEFIENDVLVSGTVVSEPIKKESYVRYIIETDFIQQNETKYVVEQKLLIYDDVLSNVFYGNTVEAQGEIAIPKNLYSEMSLLQGSQFDWGTYLKKDAIFYELFFPEITIIQEEPNSIYRKGKQTLFKLKQEFINNLETAIPEPESSLAAGEVVGVKNLLGDTLEKKFRETGIIHVVVLSGYNVTIVADSIVKSLSFLPASSALYFGIFGIILFAVLTGGGATIVRASIMAILVLVARRYGRVYNITNALFITAFVMVFFNPMILAFDPSFQLSFLATLGLIYLAPHVEQKISFITNQLSLRSILAATIATQLFVLPLLISMTGEVSIVSLVVNMLILPIVPITMFFAFLTGVAGFVSYIAANIFGFIASLFLSYQLLVVDVFSGVPFASIKLLPHSIYFIIGIYVLGYLLYIFRRRNHHDKQSST